MDLELAEKAGFTRAVQAAKDVQDRRKRLAIAFEHFRYVTLEDIETFQNQLRESTFTNNGTAYPRLVETFDVLALVLIEDYHGLPPEAVVKEVARVKDMGVFDAMEVAYVQTKRVDRDPIIFGTITGCPHRFYVAEWGDDVSINDILGKHDG